MIALPTFSNQEEIQKKSHRTERGDRFVFLMPKHPCVVITRCNGSPDHAHDMCEEEADSEGQESDHEFDGNHDEGTCYGGVEHSQGPEEEGEDEG